jgi:Flp pilus assembly protein TadB
MRKIWDWIVRHYKILIGVIGGLLTSILGWLWISERKNRKRAENIAEANIHRGKAEAMEEVSSSLEEVKKSNEDEIKKIDERLNELNTRKEVKPKALEEAANELRKILGK